MSYYSHLCLVGPRSLQQSQGSQNLHSSNVFVKLILQSSLFFLKSKEYVFIYFVLCMGILCIHLWIPVYVGTGVVSEVFKLSECYFVVNSLHNAPKKTNSTDGRSHPVLRLVTGNVILLSNQQLITLYSREVAVIVQESSPGRQGGSRHL